MSDVRCLVPFGMAVLLIVGGIWNVFYPFFVTSGVRIRVEPAELHPVQRVVGRAIGVEFALAGLLLLAVLLANRL